MSDFPSLAEVAFAHGPYQTNWEGGQLRCVHPDCVGAFEDTEEWSEHLSYAWHKSCTITTVEQLDSLPGHAVITVNTEVHTKWPEHVLASLYGPWFYTGCEVPSGSDEIGLPALLLWHPGWAAT